VNLIQSATIVTSQVTLQESAEAEDALVLDLVVTDVAVILVIAHQEILADVMTIVVTEDLQNVEISVGMTGVAKTLEVVAEIEDLAAETVLTEAEAVMIESAQEEVDEMTEVIVAEVHSKTVDVTMQRKDHLLPTVVEKIIQVINKNKNRQPLNQNDCHIDKVNYQFILNFFCFLGSPRRDEGKMDPENGVKDHNGDKEYHGKSRDEREIHNGNDGHDE
jgi:hypothetical protein